MPTDRLPVAHASVVSRSQYRLGVSSQQARTDLKWWPTDVSSRGGVTCLMSGGWRVLYSKVQCIMSNGQMGIPLHWTERHDWKHYVPATLLAVGNKDVQIIVLLDNRFSTSLTSWEQFKFTQCLCWEKWEKYVDRRSSISLHILFVWKICALANVLKYVH